MESFEDATHARGTKKVEERLPNLIPYVKEMIDGQSKTDPNFKTTILFTRMTVKEV